MATRIHSLDTVPRSTFNVSSDAFYVVWNNNDYLLSAADFGKICGLPGGVYAWVDVGSQYHVNSDVVFTTKFFDDGNWMDIVNSPTCFVVPSGVSQIALTMTFANNAFANWGYVLYINGSLPSSIVPMARSNYYDNNLTHVDWIDVTAGDILTIHTDTGGTVQNATNTASGFSNFVHIWPVGFSS